MQLHRIRITTTALHAMNPAERSFLLLAGHIHNELNSLNKVFVACLNNKVGVAAIEGLADGMQAHIYARQLAGKLLEAWNVLPSAYFGAKISQGIEASMYPDAQEALKKLKAYFKQPNVIFRVRNAFASHYSVDGFDAHWEEVAGDAGLEVVLGGTIGNNLYVGSEFVVNRAVMAAAGDLELEEAAAKFLDDVRFATRAFTTFLEGAMSVLLGKAVGTPLVKHAVVEELDTQLHVDDVVLPFFAEREPVEDQPKA